MKNIICHYVLLLLIALPIYSCSRELLYDQLPYDPENSQSGNVGPMDEGDWSPMAEFTDEFNGTTLDDTKWSPKHPYWEGREPSVFSKDNVKVADGFLQIVTSLKDAALEGSEDQPWIYTGCVSSKTQTCSYGYYEARIKACNLSVANSFWFQSSGNTIEIDVTEAVGNSKLKPDYSYKMAINTHDIRLGGWQNDIATPCQVELPDKKKSSDDYFIYGVRWEPTKLVFYLNNKKVHEIAKLDFNQKTYLFFDAEAMIWSGLPTVVELNGELTTRTMYIDWVRAYKRTDVNWLK